MPKRNRERFEPGDRVRVTMGELRGKLGTVRSTLELYGKQWAFVTLDFQGC